MARERTAPKPRAWLTRQWSLLGRARATAKAKAEARGRMASRRGRGDLGVLIRAEPFSIPRAGGMPEVTPCHIYRAAFEFSFKAFQTMRALSRQARALN